MMKQILFPVILLLFFFNSYAQKFDLVVTTTGDSIACRIDSITGDKVHFKMMTDYEWVNSSLEKGQIVSYEKDALKNKSLVFKPGTTYIEGVVEDKQINSVKDLQKNSVYAEFAGNAGQLSLNYDRLIPIGKSSAVVGRLGFGLGLSVLVGEVNYMYGGTKHFFETGFGSTTNLSTYLLSIRAGYRLQTKSGFILRVAPLGIYNKFADSNKPWSIWFGVSVGYSF